MKDDVLYDLKTHLTGAETYTTQSPVTGGKEGSTWQTRLASAD